MNTFAICVGALVISCGAIAGELAPPLGPVAPTMKDMQTVEPRIAINTTNTPGDADSLFRITQRGSYYLTDNIIAPAGFHAIEVAAPEVSIDLNGFAVRGVAGSLDGVSIDGTRFGVNIHDGFIQNVGGAGIRGVLVRGVIENISAFNCGAGGIVVGGRCVVRNCQTDFTGTAGIEVGVSSQVVGCNAISAIAGVGIRAGNGSRIESCQVRFCAGGIDVGERCQIIACAATNNSGSGIVAGLSANVTDCLAADNSGEGIMCGAGSTVIGSAAHNNTANGIFVSSGSTVIACAARSNQGNSGILGGGSSLIRACTTSDNMNHGIQANAGGVVEGCSSVKNGGIGIRALGLSHVIGNTASLNTGSGIEDGGGSVIVQNTCYGNGFGAAFGEGLIANGSGSRIEGNSFLNNDQGLTIIGSGNLVIRNSATGNTTNYVIASGNNIGTIVIPPVSGIVLGSTGGAGVGSTDPWANFSY